MRKTILLCFLVSGCASAHVTSSDNGVHTLSVGTSGAVSSPALVENAMHREAATLCPGGWEKIAERAVPRETQSPLLSPTSAVEWRIRCL